MDLRDYLRVLSRRWATIAILALLGTGVGALGTQTATPQFHATTTLFLSLQQRADAVELSLGRAFTQARVRSYAEVATSPLVTRAVIKTLRLDMTPRELSGKIKATVRPDAVLVRLTVTDSRRNRVADISNAIAERFAEVVNELESPSDSRRSPVRLTVIEPASVPYVASSPRPSVNLLLGLLIGLGVGAGIAVARESRDRSVSTPRALTEFLADIGGPPVLSSITYDPQAAVSPMAVRDTTQGARAEGFRRLSTNLRFVVDRPQKVIAVTSPLPMEGKTSVAVNLAAALAETGASVCLVDADLRRPSTARVLGLVQEAGLTTALVGQAEVHQVLQSAGPFSVLTSGPLPPNPTQLMGSSQLKTVLQALAERFDHVVVDTAPVLPAADTAVLATAVDGYLLVVRASRTSCDQLGEALRALKHTGACVLGTVLNMTKRKDGGAYGYTCGNRQQALTAGHFHRLRRLARGRQARTVPQSRHGHTSDNQLCSANTEGSTKK